MKLLYKFQPAINSYSIFLTLLLVLFTCNGASGKERQWRLTKDEKGIQVYLKNTSDSAVKSFKSTMTVSRSLSSLIAVIEDTSSYPRWLHNCRSAKTIKRESESKLVNYVVTNMPWPVADRDVIVSSALVQNKENKQVEIKLQATPNLIKKVAGKVRIKKMSGKWLLTPMANNKVKVVYELSVDPGGNIPKWVVNAMAIDLPYYTFENLRKISKEDKYANAKVKGIIE